MAANDNFVQVGFVEANGTVPADYPQRHLSVGDRVYQVYEMSPGQMCIRDKATMAGWDVSLVELIQALRGD